MKMRDPDGWNFLEGATTESYFGLVSHVHAPLAHLETALDGPTIRHQPVPQGPKFPADYPTQFILGDGVAWEKCHGLWHFSSQGPKPTDTMVMVLESVE